MENLHESSDDYNPHSCSLSGGNPCEPCSQLVDLNMEISLMERQLANLLQKRVSLKTTINHRHDRLIHGVPPEIASLIFAFYLDRILSPGNFALDSRKAPLGPLLLSRVCKKWEQIVHSTPQLWASVHIYSDCSYTTPLDKIRQMLRRSGELPLVISLNCKYSSWSGTQVIDFLKELAPRWGVLQLTMDPTLYSPLFNNITDCPHLEKLHIHNQSNQDQYPSFRLCNTPRLRDVQLTGFYFTNVGIQCHSITRIKVNYFSVDEIIEVLRQAPILSQFEIQAFGKVENLFPLPTTPIVHRRIKNLLLTPPLEDWNVHPLFDHISLPHLEAFTYSPRAKIPTAQLISAFNRFQCHITELTITDVKDEGFLMDHNLIELLSNLSTITRLSLLVEDRYSCKSKSADHLLRCLTRSRVELENPHAPFLPLLKVLKLRRRTFSWGDFANIFYPDESEIRAQVLDGNSVSNLAPMALDIQDSRRWPLREVHVDIIPENPRNGVPCIDKEVLPRLVQATEAGIVLALRDHNTGNDLLQESIRYHASC